ncbi:MAG: cation:dicarboxylase symporter family transporter [Bariatricus sp.]|nr:cation:dicarboxylase symporter family transporter [Bariatricus sp.]
MANITQTESFSLTASSIDVISEIANCCCTEHKMERRDAIRIRLSIEESLGVWLNTLGEGATVSYKTGTRFWKSYFQISAKGEPCNPYSVESEDFGHGSKSMLVNIGLIPEYSFVDGKNILTFQMKKKAMNPVLSLIMIILLSIVVGIFGRFLLGSDALALINENIILPIEDAAFRILSCIAGPMIFLSVAWGVYGIGDVYTLGRIGKKLMLSFVSVVFLFSTAGVLFYPFLGNGISAHSLVSSQFGTLFEMILNIFPANIFSPFVEGNTLQIIFLAFVIGLSMIFLGQRTSAVAKAVEQINYIITFLMGTISTFVPYFVFIVILKIIWSDSYKTLFNVWKFAFVFFAAWLVCALILICSVSVLRGVSPFFLVKSCLPSYLIALTTASSAATYESNMSVCERRFGIDTSLSSFGIPFGMVLFKPSTALYYILICFYFSKNYDIQVSVSWIVTAVIITAVSAVSTPPIPGGAAATYTMLFLQLGIPADALVITLAFDMIFDFFLTSGDMLLLLVELFSISSKIGMQNMDVVNKCQQGRF